MAPAKRKDFSNISTERVYNTINNATAEPKERPVYTEEQAEQFKQAGKTEGRKGVKMPRINFALSSTNYSYVQTMSRVMGLTMTDFINIAIAEHQKNHADIYQKAKEFRDSLT